MNGQREVKASAHHLRAQVAAMTGRGFPEKFHLGSMSAIAIYVRRAKPA
jgi:hypothetical protein